MFVSAVSDAWLQSADEALERLRQTGPDALSPEAAAAYTRQRRASRKRIGKTQVPPVQWAGLRWTPPPGWQPSPWVASAGHDGLHTRPPPPPSSGSTLAPPTPWEILGVREGMPLDVCEAVFKRLSLHHHPEREGGDVKQQAALGGAIEAIRRHYGATRAKD